jgi:hypothetical protein
MIKNYWKRFNIYQQGLAALFIVALFLDVINKKVLNSAIPVEIVGYLFWLSLGLFLGFKLCKYEYIRALRKHSEEQQQQN